MDWSRAKTILIVIFFFLNLFLFYNVYIQESKVIVITSQDISNIKSILEDNDIELNTTLMRKITPKASVKIEDVSYNHEQLVSNFFNTQNVKVVENEDGKIYSKGSETLEIFKNNRVVYKNSEPIDDINGYSKNKIIKYVEKFLKDRNFYPSYAKVKSYESTEDGYTISYNQVYRTNEIFASYMNVELSNNGITQIDKFWLNPIQFDESSKNVIKTPIEILLEFARNVDKKRSIKIEELTLGYYFPMENYNNALFTATPAWKIRTFDDKVYYYNAYQGYLENTNDKE